MNETNLDEVYAPFETEKLLSLDHDQHEPLLQKVMENGKRLMPTKTLEQIVEYSRKRLSQLPEEYKRFEKPSSYQVGLSKELKIKRNELINKYKNKSEHTHENLNYSGCTK